MVFIDMEVAIIIESQRPIIKIGFVKPYNDHTLVKNLFFDKHQQHLNTIMLQMCGKKSLWSICHEPTKKSHIQPWK